LVTFFVNREGELSRLETVKLDVLPTLASPAALEKASLLESTETLGNMRLSAMQSAREPPGVFGVHRQSG